MLKPLLRHSLIWILMLMIFALGVLTIKKSVSAFLTSAENNYEFSSDSEVLTYPGLKVRQFKDHKLQKYIETLVEMNCKGRNHFIGINNQIYYSLFKRSFSLQSAIVIGKNKQLLSLGHIITYCQLHDAVIKSQEQLSTRANQIKKLSDFFEKRGKTFIYVATPAKAEHMHEAIPDRFHCQSTGLNVNLAAFEKLLAERKIPYVNGSSLTFDATKKYGIPMFPQGGIHWNWLAATITANAIIDAINQNGRLSLTPIRFEYTMEKPSATDSDMDFLGLLRLLKPDANFTVPKMNFINVFARNKPTKMAIIGGSFNTYLIEVFLKNKTVAKIDFYFYLKTHKIYTSADKKLISKPVDLSSTTLLDPILSADVVILEENSEYTVSDYGKLLYDLMKKAKLII